MQQFFLKVNHMALQLYNSQPKPWDVVGMAHIIFQKENVS
jgi:hypothetical protein